VLDQLRQDEAVVPALWQLEVANVLLVAEAKLVAACRAAGVPLVMGNVRGSEGNRR
jgi:hypothetical protein